LTLGCGKLVSEVLMVHPRFGHFEAHCWGLAAWEVGLVEVVYGDFPRGVGIGQIG
jgi:hypothetical protein